MLLATDYSEIITKRLRNELGYNTAQVDLWNINPDLGQFDIIVLAGGVYESEDYSLPRVAYTSFTEILNQNDVIIQFLNGFDNFANRSCVLQLTLRKLLNSANYNLIRRMFWQAKNK